MCVPGWGYWSLIPLTFWGTSHRSVSSPRGPSAGSSAEVPTAASWSQSQELEAGPSLEGLASCLGGSFDEGLDSGTSSSPDHDTPDETSDSSSVVSRGGQDRPSVSALGSHPDLQTILLHQGTGPRPLET